MEYPQAQSPGDPCEAGHPRRSPRGGGAAAARDFTSRAYLPLPAYHPNQADPPPRGVGGETGGAARLPPLYAFVPGYPLKEGAASPFFYKAKPYRILSSASFW